MIRRPCSDLIVLAIVLFSRATNKTASIQIWLNNTLLKVLSLNSVYEKINSLDKTVKGLTLVYWTLWIGPKRCSLKSSSRNKSVLMGKIMLTDVHKYRTRIEIRRLFAGLANDFIKKYFEIFLHLLFRFVFKLT